MFLITPSVEFQAPHVAVRSKLYDAVEALRVANAKLELAREVFVPTEHYLENFHISRVHATVKLYAVIFQELIGDSIPTLPTRVFSTIREYANRLDQNSEHLEGATIAMRLAVRAIDDAMNLSAQLDGMEVDDTYELMLAATFNIEAAASVVDCAMSWKRNSEDVLDSILDGGELVTV